MTEYKKPFGPETKADWEKRIKQRTRDYLDADEDIMGSPTLRNMVEETIKPDTMEAFYSLLEKLRNAPYYDKLANYKGHSEANAFVDRLINIIHDRD